MRIAILTDAWKPQVNGVVTILVELVDQLERLGHQVLVIEPGMFETRPCPGYAEISLARNIEPRLTRELQAFEPQAIHLATEGPLGSKGRKYCLARKLPFTTAFHTRFPEILNAALKVPTAWGYWWFRRFHAPSQRVMVPAPATLRMLEQRGFKNTAQWTHGVDGRVFCPGARDALDHLNLPRPIHLFVGRVSYEKNIEAFLQLPLSGSKVVCGVGPLEAKLKARYENVTWLGILPRLELAAVYRAADVFVFPSKSDTFGLTMLEAMACGTPVAAYPVEGPIDVIADSPAGVMHEDLAQATEKAGLIDRSLPPQRAALFDDITVAQQFLAMLAPIAPAVVQSPASPVAPALPSPQ
jgi:glycosyltransferase involved in cell wall biosynthesis